MWGSCTDRRSVSSTTSDALREPIAENRAEFCSRQPVQEPRTSAGSLLRVWPATVLAAEPALGCGKHFKIRPPDKDDGVPQGVSRGMWGELHRPSQCIEYNERCPARTNR